jgi:hypothetical protein
VREAGEALVMVGYAMAWNEVPRCSSGKAGNTGVTSNRSRLHEAKEHAVARVLDSRGMEENAPAVGSSGRRNSG